MLRQDSDHHMLRQDSDHHMLRRTLHSAYQSYGTIPSLHATLRHRRPRLLATATTCHNDNLLARACSSAPSRPSTTIPCHALRCKKQLLFTRQFLFTKQLLFTRQHATCRGNTSALVPYCQAPLRAFCQQRLLSSLLLAPLPLPFAHSLPNHFYRLFLQLHRRTPALFCCSTSHWAASNKGERIFFSGSMCGKPGLLPPSCPPNVTNIPSKGCRGRADRDRDGDGDGGRDRGRDTRTHARTYARTHTHDHPFTRTHKQENTRLYKFLTQGNSHAPPHRNTLNFTPALSTHVNSFLPTLASFITTSLSLPPPPTILARNTRSLTYILAILNLSRSKRNAETIMALCLLTALVVRVCVGGIICGVSSRSLASLGIVGF